MQELINAKEPFRFCARLHLPELTGLRAVNLAQLLDLIDKAPDSCIYNHTHRFLQQHQYLSPEPPNDFAFWVTEIIGERKLGEELASIDTVQYSSIESLRSKIAEVIRSYLGKNPLAKLRFAVHGEEFHFIKSVSFIMPTGYTVNNLEEFTDILKKVTIDSIYFHVFEARLRLERKANDFSNWIETSIGDKELADKISKLNPYMYTLEELRKMIIRLIERRYPH